jgi:hypothetical protein
VTVAPIWTRFRRGMPSAQAKRLFDQCVRQHACHVSTGTPAHCAKESCLIVQLAKMALCAAKTLNLSFFSASGRRARDNLTILGQKSAYDCVLRDATLVNPCRKTTGPDRLSYHHR